MQLSNQRSQSAKPTISTLPSRNIQSALPKTTMSSAQRVPSARLPSARTPSARVFSAKQSIATELFDVQPKEVVFTDILAHVKYEKMITIRNLTKHPCRIRVTQPKTTRFRVDFDMQQGIAAGLAMKVLVMFQTNSVEDFKDSIQIASDEFQTEIRLSALKSCAKLKFEQFIDFGFVQQGTENKREIKIMNCGHSVGKVQFKLEAPSLKLTPNLLSVEVGQTAIAMLVYKANEMGSFRATIDLICDGATYKIDVAATSVDYTRFLMDAKGSQLTTIDFGEFFIGKQKTIKAKYVNNSPKGYNFRIFPRKGLHLPNEETVNLQTPNELGVEQSEAAIQIKPDRGYIQAYSTVEVEIVCNAQLSLKEQLQARSFCFSDKCPEPKEYKYSLCFQQPDEDLIVHVLAKALVPILKVQKSTLQFGECEVNENLDNLFSVTNINAVPLQLEFAKVSCFFFKPEKVIVGGLASIPIQATFVPKNVGKYNQNIEMILNDYLRVSIKATGEANKIARKRPQTRGPEARPEDFQLDPKYIDTQKVQYEKKRGGVEGYFQDSERPKDEPGKSFLIDQRANRLEKQRQRIIEQRVDEIKKLQQDQDVGKVPKDYEFEFGLGQEATVGDIDLPMKKDTLFVLKPIYEYEPLKIEEGEVIEFKADPNAPVKRLLSGRPQSHKQVRDIRLELSPLELKKIYAGPIKIEFGTIYVNTVMYKTFSVKNDLRNSIACRMIVDKEELRHTFKDMQIIDSGQTGQFEIGVCAQGLGQFKQIMKYLINDRHPFEILIVANVETVKLDVSKTQVKMGFPEDSLNMTASESIKLTNNGNGEAKFQFIQVENSKFIVDPISGVIAPSSNVIIQLTYNPSLIMKNPDDPESDAIFKAHNPTRQDEEKMTLKVTDGQDTNIRLIGVVNDIKCTTKSIVDMQEVAVCTLRQETMQIKNTSRNNAVYRVLTDYLPMGCTITPQQGRIGPDDNKEFIVKFQSNQPRMIDTNILFMLRSGRVLRIPLIIQCIVPLVSITQELFDFGDVTTLGNQTAVYMTIVNKSTVNAELCIDIRGEEINPKALDGIDCIVIKQQTPILRDFLEEGSTQEQEEEDKDKKLSLEKSNKKLLLTVPANGSVNFNLHFYPKELKHYQFYFPIELHHYGIIDELKRLLICRGCQPKFVVEPKKVDFGRKVILTPPEKNKPQIAEILFSNPEYESASFRIVCDSQDKVFSVVPLAGRVDGGQTLRVKAIFNPRYDGQYSKAIQIYLQDSKPNQPYMIVQLVGNSTKPSVLFDRREAILCPVPLGIESRLIFKVFNDGFENQKLNFKPAQGFSLEFIDGQSVGITKQSLLVLAKFQSNTPISITQNLEIIDETQHSYGITISGTADNCTLTTFPYLDGQNQYQVSTEGRGPPNIVELNEHSETEESVSDQKAVKFQVNHKATQQLNNYTGKCEHFQRWYNMFVGVLPQFPGSIIQSNGQQLLDLICFLSGRNQFPFKVNLEGIKQRVQIVAAIFTFYKELILMLKTDGALLNQIRPCYLLNYEDYCLHLKSVESKFTHQNHQKMTAEQFEQVSRYSHLVLVYQILRLYYLQRVTLKAIRNVANINEYGMSTLYSTQECLLIKWVEYQVAAYWKEPVRFKYADLKDGQILAALVLSYLGTGGLKFFQPLGVQQVKLLQDNNHNMNILHKGLHDVGIESHFQLDDFKNFANPETTLLMMSLFTQLPNYIPKSTPLMFQCILGAVVVKTIQLHNTTKEPLSYWVKLETLSPDFSIEEDSIRLEPNAKYSYNVKFTSRVSQEQVGTLTFSNRKDNKTIAAALVYELKGVVTERVSQMVWTVAGTLYEPKEFSINVVNQFTNSEFGHFTISIIPVKVPIVIEAPKKKKKALSMAEKKKEAEQEILEKQRIERLQNIEPLPAFFCKQESIRLKRGAQYNLPMQFLPIAFYEQRCYVVFQDISVGEFQYEIIATVGAPEVLIDLKPDLSVFIDSPLPFSQHIPFINPLLKSAQKQVDQLTSGKRKSALSQLQRQNSNSITSKVMVPMEDSNFVVYCEEGKSYIDCDKQITLVNYNNIVQQQLSHKSDEEGEQAQIQTDLTKNLLNFTLNFKSAVKDYQSHFTMINETKTDVRRIRIQVTSLPKPIKATIEMICPAGEVVSQDIPIVNSTDRDFNLKVTLTGDSRFSVLQTGDSKKKNQKDQIIKKHTNGAVTVMFSPQWVCEGEATLSIINALTNDCFEYTLKGKGEEPLSEGHFTVKAIARQPIKQTIKVENKLDIEVRYSVETDLMNTTGESEITIPPKSTYDYVLLINPLLSGQFTGSVTFTGNGVYRWWTVTIDTATPKAQAIVDLMAPVRKAVAFDIEIGNPLHENITYEVLVEGESLVGDVWFSVLPGTTSTYQLIFQPLQEGRWKGSIAFLHPKMGEIWYQLNLVAEDKGGVRVPQFKTELGKTDKYEILLENPSGKSVTTEIEISNLNNFSVEFDGGKELILEPYSMQAIYIVFTPSALTAHSGEVIIKTKEIGKWIYLCFGTGEPPTPFPSSSIVCKVGSSVTHQIEFKNPLRDCLNVQLSLEQDAEAFDLLLKKQRISIQPQSTLLIPYQFMPTAIQAYKCNVVLMMSNQVRWTYPLLGQTESDPSNFVHLIQTKCRIPLKMQLSVKLDGLAQPEKVMYKIADADQLKTWLKINLANHVIKDVNAPLIFDIIFNPLKPFKKASELQVKVESGGVWRFKLQINALEPQQDDVIVVESDINKLTKVQFKLTNRFPDFANYKAYFTPESNQEFTVEPMVGMLEPYGKKGTEFRVGFKPREYGKRKEAKLIIETEQMYWSYILRGHLPKYIPPNMNKQQRDDLQQLQLQHDDKNFVIENLKIPRVSPRQKKPQ